LQKYLQADGDCHRPEHRFQPVLHAIADHLIDVDLREDRHHQLRQDQHQAAQQDEQGASGLSEQATPDDWPDRRDLSFLDKLFVRGQRQNNPGIAGFKFAEADFSRTKCWIVQGDLVANEPLKNEKMVEFPE